MFCQVKGRDISSDNWLRTLVDTSKKPINLEGVDEQFKTLLRESIRNNLETQYNPIEESTREINASPYSMNKKIAILFHTSSGEFFELSTYAAEGFWKDVHIFSNGGGDGPPQIEEVIEDDTTDPPTIWVHIHTTTTTSPPYSVYELRDIFLHHPESTLPLKTSEELQHVHRSVFESGSSGSRRDEGWSLLDVEKVGMPVWVGYRNVNMIHIDKVFGSE